ncbi:MAG TPA: flagellar motor switch protein FliN [Henriciella marina]|uniref:FliM/FliN family flagellar motor switch protein n=1 Tax=Henriciella sp. TaxID=1968823 RepID=UPI0017991905|nr:FliM/FliN family flagellar motor switch protein [Henriciella sp.]HIG21682.1 flagellar motor switch protein FliN [Henriciella sp.]HIK66327.1 flagellar motor switch protein FliN [Henriciella marina]
MANPEVQATSDDAEDRRDTSPVNQFRRAIYGVPVTLTVSVGQRRLSVQEVLDLTPDSVIALDSRIEDPVRLMVDDKLIARGELVETDNGGIAVKITEIAEEADASEG